MSVIDEEKLLQAAKEASGELGEIDSILRLLDKLMELVNHPIVSMLIEGFMRPRAPAARPVDPLQAVLQGPDDPEMFKRYLNNIITIGPGGGVVGGGGGPGPTGPQVSGRISSNGASLVEAPLEDIDLEGNEAPPVGAEPPKASSAKAKLIALINQLSEEDAEEILSRLGGNGEAEGSKREDTGDTDSNT